MAYAIFLSSAAFIAYTLTGYPVLVRLLSAVRPRPHKRLPIEPAITIVVAAHNSADLIRAKLENTLALDYPTHKRDIVVASDCSVDGTNEVVRSFTPQGVILADIKEHRGKHHAQRVALAMGSGEIVVFTDSAIHLEEGSLRAIVANFADDKVGAVSSEDVLTTESGESAYVSAELELRRAEALFGSLVGMTGAFFAVRRSLCEEWHPEQSSDFFLALHAVEQGLRTVVEPEAIARYGVTASSGAEFRRKVRTIVHGLDVFFDHLPLLNLPKYGFFSVQLISHKLFRWLLPFSFITLFVSSFFLWHVNYFFKATLILQCIGYSLAIIALVWPGSNEFKLPRLAAFFVLSMSSTLKAWYKFVRGEKYIIWEPTHR